jgi:hypothetical protein
MAWHVAMFKFDKNIYNVLVQIVCFLIFFFQVLFFPFLMSNWTILIQSITLTINLPLFSITLMIGMKIDVRFLSTLMFLKIDYVIIVGHFVSITNDGHES